MEGILAGAAVTLVLERVMSYAKNALICKRVCRKLEAELERIHPHVRKIELQLIERRRMNPVEQPLDLVEEWLAKLKQALDVAEMEVFHCNSGSRVNIVENFQITKRIQSHLTKIQQTAGNDVERAILSSTLFNGSSHGSSTHNAGWHSSPEGSHHDHSHHRPGISAGVSGIMSPGIASQGSIGHHQWTHDMNRIEHAADETERQNNLTHGHPHYSFDQFQQPHHGYTQQYQHHSPQTYYLQDYLQDWLRPGHI